MELKEYNDRKSHQDSLDTRKKQYEDINKKWLDEKKEIQANLNKKISELTKDIGKTKPIDIKKLQEENTRLQKESDGLSNLVKNTKAENDNKTKEEESLKKSIAKLDENINKGKVLQDSIPILKEQEGKLIAQKTQKETDLKTEVAKEKQVDDIQKEIDVLVGKIATQKDTKQNFEKSIGGIKQQQQTEEAKQENNNKTQAEIKGIESQIKANFEKEVSATTQSRTYSTQKLATLLKYCDNEEIKRLVPIVSTYKAQLEDYKKLVDIITEARQTISVHYNANKVGSALTKLQQASSFASITAEQRGDVEKYKSILPKYCNTTSIFHTMSLGVDGYMPSFPAEVQKEMRLFLTQNPSIKDYPFLLREVNNYIGNGFYKTSVQKVTCN
jgi:myosin heavy subunit